MNIVVNYKTIKRYNFLNIFLKWSNVEIVRFLVELHTIEAYRHEYPNYYNGPVHFSGIPPLEQMEMIDEIMESYD